MNFNKTKFVHLNIHSEFSIIDGLIKIDELVNLSYNLNINSISITDFSNLFGLIDFYEKSLLNEIKPIIGSDFYIYFDFLEKKISKLTILSYTNLGLKNLILLITQSYKHKYNYKFPIIDNTLLLKFNKGLLIISGGLEGNIGENIINNNYKNISNILYFYKKFFKNRFYIELNRLGKSNEELYIFNALEISKKYNVPVVATNKVRFLYEKNFHIHEIKVAIHESKTINNKSNLYTKNQYLKTENEMCNLFLDIPEAVFNTIEISKRCNVFINLNKKFIPKFKINKEDDTKYLNELSKNGLENRLKKLYINKYDYIKKYKIYNNRLNKELEIINKMEFSGYFLIVMEFIQWAKKNNIPVGPGRGSGAGSLVSYCLNITNIDPIFFKLIFERFLNPERISMPDLDIDFCMDKRDLVINHVIKLYGKDFVSRIITFNSLTAKSVIKDVGRVLGYTFNFINKISMLIPINPKITLDKSLMVEKKLYDLYHQDLEVKKIIDISKKLEGYVRNIGKHSGGLVISPYKLTNFMPIYNDKSEIDLTQFDKNSIEKIGLVKFDFLGLKTLTIMNEIINKINIKCDLKNKIDINKITLKDKKSFIMLRSCKTSGIFQLESKGIKDLIKRLKPESFEDIVNLIALFRPGPLKSGMVDNFINRRNKIEKIFYPDKNWQHESLKDILLPTYGIILYQEQIIKIAQVFAGYSLSESDLFRQVISKKNKNEMKKQKIKFISGSNKKGINIDLSNKIFDLIEKFSGYGFNRSHSVSYALISYQMLWIKSNYTKEFMSSVMTSCMNNDKKIKNLLNECLYLNIKVLNININTSKYNFYINKDDNIEYGFGSIKGIGENVIKEIIENRDKYGKFNNLLDLCIRISLKKLNKSSLILLINSGSLDIFKISKEEMLKKLNNYIIMSEQYNKTKLNKQIDMFGLSSIINNK